MAREINLEGLNAEQRLAAQIVAEGGNLFISGSGGYGKSFLAERLKTPKTLVCAPTGAAALVVGGMTNHRAFNAPVGVIKPTDYKKITKETKSVLKELDMLILDEISMVRCDMLEHIDACLKFANENNLPFGGKQVIAVGDFYQLSAFVSRPEASYYRKLYGNRVMAFEAKCWNFNTVELETPMRNTLLNQVEILGNIRKGVSLGRSVAKLNDWAKGNSFTDVTTLCSFNKDADKENLKRFNQLDAPKIVSIGKAKGNKGVLKRELRVPEVLELKQGMRVMTVMNHEDGEYINGSVGILQEVFYDLNKDGSIAQVTSASILLDNGDLVSVEPYSFECIKYVQDKGMFKKSVIASLTQLPIIPAWALSIHKAQGATLDKAHINLGKYTFADALTYVAVSRVRDLNNISFTREVLVDDIKVNSKVRVFYEK